jgi:hypothetical protein
LLEGGDVGLLQSPEVHRPAGVIEGVQQRGLDVVLERLPLQFLRYVVPFVKTPTNVLRLGWKMTPGLNMAQAE